MNGTIIPLTIQNFSLNDNSLMINIPGAVLVYFKQLSCNHCKAFDSIFNTISVTERRIKYAVVNLEGINREIAKMAQSTKTPISGTPHLLIYVNGRPSFRYAGAKNAPSIITFIGKCLQELQPSNSFISHQQPPLGMHQQQIQSVFGSGQQQQLHPDPEEDVGFFEPVNLIPKNRPWKTAMRR